MATGKSPMASPSSHLNQGVVDSRGYQGGNSQGLARTPSNPASASTAAPNGYFPQQYLPPEHGNQDDLTLLNTRANAQSVSGASPFAAAAAADGGMSVISPTASHLRPAKFTEEWDASQRGSSILDASGAMQMQRSNSFAGSTAESQLQQQQQLSRGNTLKKKASLRRSGSLKRSGSRRSMKAGSVRSLALQSSNDGDEMHSAFYCPVPTTGNPTETLAGRFQAWRKILKDLITYFREIQTHYEHRSKSLLKLSNVINNTRMPPGFVGSGGLEDALNILGNYNKQAIAEANKAREIEEDVILALTGLRSDLHQKIKEIKNLAGDFKNSVDKEMDVTRRSVKTLSEALGQSELDSATMTGKQDPYLLRLAVDRQLERQLEEENYLHRAYLNLENSGRELESIVVGEIQKAYNAYAGILKREGDAAFNTVDELRSGPIAMPKDHEWSQFVKRDDKFVTPDVAVRAVQYIHYPGRDHYACQEIREGLLERKSKYLRSYTAGWFVLSPTHLHEFRSADKSQAPGMSLYLPEQKLGSHSTEGASSNKFILKGRQTGSMHRGHTWVFRAESYDTMMAWYEDIRALSDEKSPEERSNFVRGHSRSLSRTSQRSISSDGAVEDDDDDEQPFAPDSAVIISNRQSPHPDSLQRRPSPGGRFPSDLTVNAERGMQVPPISPASVNSPFQQQLDGNQHHLLNAQRHDAATIAAAGALPGSDFGQYNDPRLGYGSTMRTPLNEAASHAAIVSSDAREDGVNPYTSEPIYAKKRLSGGSMGAGYGDFHPAVQPTSRAGADVGVSRGLSTHSTHSNHHHNSYYQQQQQAPAATSPTDALGIPNGYSPEASRAAASTTPIVVPVPVRVSEGAAQQSSGGSSTGPDSDSFVSGGGGTGNAAYDGVLGYPPQAGQHQQQPRTTGAEADFVNGGSVSKKSRPGYGAVRNDSVPTISNLHIPGGYPKSTPTTQ